MDRSPLAGDSVNDVIESDKSSPLAHGWWRNQLAVTVATFIGSIGFTLVMPFLPLYFRLLGVTDVGEIALWSGVSLGITPALAGVLAPMWGGLADRYGRKIMVTRALVSFIGIMTALAYVTAPWQVLALRAAHGLFAGYGVLTVTMAAESAPRERMARSIGMVQMAQRLGPAMGPVIGGGLAGIVGLRRTFLVAAGVYVGALIVVLVLYREPKRGTARLGKGPEGRLSVRGMAGVQHFWTLVGVIFALQYAERSLGPVLPLYIGRLGVPSVQVPLWSGVLFTLVAGTGAFGNHVCGRLLERCSTGAVMLLSASLATLGVGLAAGAHHVGVLLAALPIFGLAAGVGMTAAYTAAGREIPPGSHGVAFGVLSSGALAGMALSPVLSGLLGAVSIRAVFVLDTLGLGALSLVTLRAMAGSTRADDS